MDKTERLTLRNGPWGTLCLILVCGLILWQIELPAIFHYVFWAFVAFSVIAFVARNIDRFTGKSDDELEP